MINASVSITPIENGYLLTDMEGRRFYYENKTKLFAKLTEALGIKEDA